MARLWVTQLYTANGDVQTQRMDFLQHRKDHENLVFAVISAQENSRPGRRGGTTREPLRN
jgi:hypothetical protein